ncbi:MAG: glycosyltransferase family 9 protein [Bacteroidaceae bacterium]|nr:glycosyltransferase family 9 protein [Bacteroidaceae bacterium]
MAQERNNNGLTVFITRFSAVGDIAMTIPLLYSLAETYPQHRFIFASRKRFCQFFINKPDNIELAGIELDDYKGICGLRRLYKELKDEYNPDVVADLHDVLRTKILRTFFALGGTKTAKIIKGHAEKRRLARSRNKCLEPLATTFERYRDVFTRIGLPFTPDFVSLFKEGKGDISEFVGVLPQKGVDKWVGVAPFARHKGKIYPMEHMRTVVKLLSEQQGIKVVCFGNGPEEESVVNDWCNSFANVHSFIGKTNFNGELRLISHLDVMLCMDSANMHMASLVNTPAVSIWGATSPLAGFLGWRQSSDDCIQLSMDCRPCSVFGNKPCRFGDYRCMNIPPEDVAKHIIKKIGK